MLFTLARPATFVALLLAFLCAIVLRATAIRVARRRLGLGMRTEPLVDLRRDVDPFGAVGALICGIGWGKTVSVDEVPLRHSRGRGALFFLAGPLTCILAGEILIAANAVLYGDGILTGYGASGILSGALMPADHVPVVPVGEECLLAFAVGILTFGLLALVPIPPLDGFGVLYFALRRPGPGIHWMRVWFEEKNIGTVVLVALCIFPLPGGLLLSLVGILASPFLAFWGAFA